MTKTIDLNYRPKSYFGPRKLESYLISQVKGTVVREQLERLAAEGRSDELSRLLGISTDDLERLGALHPALMGGNYLPDTDVGEVEIARIEIASTTGDVICLYAKKIDGLIKYRVVDEYDGDTLTGPAEIESDKPLSLGEMTEFFLGAWSLIEVLEMNFEADLERTLGFFQAKSNFYKDFDRLCRQRVIEAFPEPDEEGDSEQDDNQ